MLSSNNFQVYNQDFSQSNNGFAKEASPTQISDTKYNSQQFQLNSTHFQLFWQFHEPHRVEEQNLPNSFATRDIFFSMSFKFVVMKFLL